MNSLLAIAILAHATLGCCAHKAHSEHASTCTPSGAADEIVEAKHDHGCCTAPTALASASQRNHESSPEAPHACRHVNCLWTAGDSSSVEQSLQGEFLLVYSLAAQLPSVDGAVWFALAPAFSTGSVSIGPLCPAPSLRTHLALGVLLI